MPCLPGQGSSSFPFTFRESTVGTIQNVLQRIHHSQHTIQSLHDKMTHMGSKEFLSLVSSSVGEHPTVDGSLRPPATAQAFRPICFLVLLTNRSRDLIMPGMHPVSVTNGSWASPSFLPRETSASG